MGEASAKNLAVRHAHGDYVVVLDADDVFLPRRLEALAWLAVHHPDLDILVTDAIVEVNGTPIRRAYHPGWIFPSSDQRVAILDRNFVLGMCAVRRHRWEAAEGFDPQLAYAADWEFWLRLILERLPRGAGQRAPRSVPAHSGQSQLEPGPPRTGPPRGVVAGRQAQRSDPGGAAGRETGDTSGTT